MFQDIKKTKHINFIIFFIILCVMAISSCVPHKKLIYLQDSGKRKDSSEKITLNREEQTANTIQPGDELYVRVNSSDELPTSFSQTQNYFMGDVTLMSYSVDEEGYIKLPYIGRIKVQNMMLHEAADIIENELSQYLYLPSVDIKFVNKYVTILGEVGSPGVYTFFDKQISILQAIGYAGDITNFGNRKEVLLLRENGNEVTKHRIDLTRDDLLSSELYTVRPKDIIYVEPLKRKKWGMETFPYSIFFTTISSAILIFTFLGFPIFY